MKAKELFQAVFEKIKDIYPESEAKSIALLLLSEKYGIDRTTVLANQIIVFNQDQYNDLLDETRRLSAGEPVQYVIGSAHFYGLTLKVTPDVLIPRPETEELIDLVIREAPSGSMKILDIGTGSGCIALALKSALKESEIYAMDISEAALSVARENSQNCGLPLYFIHDDILAGSLPPGDFDIWISNPPYVRESERTLMHDNVVNHEPPGALFVPDNDPLLFYREILRKGQKCLKPGGRIYFEINESFGREIQYLFEEQGYRGGRVMRDMNGKDRMAAAVK